MKADRHEGRRTARPGRGRPREVLAAHVDWLLARHAEADDLSLADWQDALLQTHGVRVCLSTIWCFFERRGFSFKKTLFAAEQHRAATAAARAAWREAQPSLDPDRLIFLDETGTTTNMQAHAWPLAARQPAARLCACHGHWKVATFVSGLRSSGIPGTGSGAGSHRCCSIAR